MIDAPARLSTVPNRAMPASTYFLGAFVVRTVTYVTDVEVALVGRLLVDDDLVVGLRCMARDEMELVRTSGSIPAEAERRRTVPPMALSLLSTACA